MKDISFIIPVYNTPIDKLGNCIKSILTVKKKFDIEIIVIDDGSEENINTFFKKHFFKEVRYFYKENGGVSSARNEGISIAEGKFVFFVDADDIILEDAFDNINIKDEYQLILFDIDVIENSKNSIWKVLNCNSGVIQKNDIIVELVTSNKMNSPCSKLFLNECIKQNNIRFDESMVTGEDMNFVIDFIKCVTEIYYTGKSAYCYQREEASRITRIKKFPEIYFNNLSFLRDKLEKLIDEYNMESKYKLLLNIDHVESLYNYISDLITLKMCSKERRNRVSNEIRQLEINCSNVSRKKQIKYHLLYHNNWFLIYVLAYIRRIYLRFK